MTRRHVTVALSGDGGDELWCGYERYFQAATLRPFRQRAYASAQSCSACARAEFPAVFGTQRRSRYPRAGAPTPSVTNCTRLASLLTRTTSACILGSSAIGRTPVRSSANAIRQDRHRSGPTPHARRLHGAPAISRYPDLPARRYPHQGRSRLHGSSARGARAHDRPPRRRTLLAHASPHACYATARRNGCCVAWSRATFPTR